MSEKVAVTYKGTTTSELGDWYSVDGEDGTTYILHAGVSTAVPREVADALENTKGHKFEVGKEAEATVAELKADLDERGIDYPSSATKAELLQISTDAETNPEPVV